MRLKEKRMNAENSLRLLIEKWLTPTMATRVQVTRFRRVHPNRRRYVRVEALRSEGSVAIFFFQHDDGTWRVFPQETRRPTLHAYAIAG
jgi:hypothetical protein